MDVFFCRIASRRLRSSTRVPRLTRRLAAPLVWLHSEDPFRPSDLLQHVHHTRPTVDQSPIAGLPKLSLDNLETLNRVKTGQVALTSKDDVTTLPAWILGKVPDESGRTVNATPCVVVAVERGPQDLDAFYFYFYSYNRGANLTQVMEPVNRLIQDVEHGMHFGDHVGDWCVQLSFCFLAHILILGLMHPSMSQGSIT